MPRKPTPAPADKSVPFNDAAYAADAQAADVLGAIVRDANADRDLMNQLLGQVQMADAFSKLGATVAISKLAYVKEHKLYQGLAGMKNRDRPGFAAALTGETVPENRDGPGLEGTWEEFCSLLGTSASKVNEDIKNLQAFGEQALESMSRMGLGYRDMRQYRRLPEDQRALLIEMAKKGDKDGLLDMAEEIASQAEKSKKEVEDLKGEVQAREELITAKNKRIDTLERDKKRIAKLPPDEQLKLLMAELSECLHETLGCIRGKLRQGLIALKNHGDEDHTVVMGGLVGQVQAEIIALRAEFQLPDMAAAADRELAAEVAEWAKG